MSKFIKAVFRVMVIDSPVVDWCVKWKWSWEIQSCCSVEKATPVYLVPTCISTEPISVWCRIGIHSSSYSYYSRYFIKYHNCRRNGRRHNWDKSI